jgi:putative Holliday junction resolvase
MKKILVLDVGTKGIGVAKGYMENHMIFPVYTLSRKSVKKDASLLAELCTKEGIDHLVVGLPLLADGSEGRSARLARQVGDALKERTGISVDYEDESDSSIEAAERLQQAGRNNKEQRSVIDQEAAVVILERWFSSQG